MNFIVIVVFVFLSLHYALSYKCSQILHDSFKKGLDLSNASGKCKISSPGIFFQGENWAGFSINNQFFLFKNWNCRTESILLNKPYFFAVATRNSCELSEKIYDLDERCLKEFNRKMCNKLSGHLNDEVLEDEFLEKLTFMNPVDDKNGTPFILKDSPTVSTIFIEKRRTGSAGVSSTKATSKTTFTDTTKKSSIQTISTTESSTGATSSEEISTEAKTETTFYSVQTEDISTKFKTSSIPTSAISSTTISPIVNKTCEYNEFFFQDHCYFFYSISLPRNEFLDLKYTLEVHKSKFPKEAKKVYKSETNFSRYCQNRHPRALGLAVESKRENSFILDIVKKKFHSWLNFTVFTSGIRIKGQYDYWQGWNLKIDKSVLNFGENRKNEASDVMFYCIDPIKGRWVMLESNDPILWYWRLGLMCERPYNPKNIQLKLHEKCLQLYRKSPCYNVDFHVNYCCEKDETGEIWFACPDETSTKAYLFGLICKWKCQSEGFFFKDRPVCTGNDICNGSHNNINYIAPITRYAISDCPGSNWGHSAWYCHINRTFLGTPDYSLCCATFGKMCRDTDVFLNVWMGCPSKKIIKKTACPPGSLLEEAFVEWYCQKNGTFNNTTPDYSNCNKSEKFCKNKDRYGTEWVANVGATEKKNCPSSFTGMCFWKCENSGHFDGPEPDCTKCRAGWMDELSNMIKNFSRHEEVMNLMENYTKKEDLRTGYSHILNLTHACVVLFKNQNSEDNITIFDRFLGIYSKIFKNVGGNPILWSSLSTSNRKQYSEVIIKITQDAAFANLMFEDVTNRRYNATLARAKTDGFDFFVAYNPPVGSQFPLENFFESEWHLDLKEVNGSNPIFAVMGLVMGRLLSSLMFPQGNKTDDLELNAPAITFTVAASRNNQVIEYPNVIVAVSFKHNTRTRFPQTKVIKRRLHYGERPSGVFNSTVCCYYRESKWITEGCFTTFKSKDRTNCTCNHLSTIALLMTTHKYEPDLTLELISVISSGITIASLILALLVFYFADAVKNDRVFIGKNLCFCLLVGHTMLITVMDKKFFNIPDDLCTVYAVVLHYTFMAAFAWMFVEGCHLYRMLILVFDSDKEYKWVYLLIGYGVPFVIVGVTELIGFWFQEQPYGQDELCWLKTPHYVWAFVGPVIVSTSVCTLRNILSSTRSVFSFINFCILIIAMKLAISTKRRIEKSSNFTTFKLWIKGWMSLSTLLGITWLFGLAYIHYNETCMYIFAIFNGLQGFFIFLFRCILCDQYKVIIQKKVKSWFSISKSNHHKKCDNMKSETKEYAISAGKSSSDEMDDKNLEIDPGLNRLEGIEKCQKTLIFYLNNNGKNTGNSSEIGTDLNVSLTPVMSEAYLRNRMIARNFSSRKSKVL